METVYILQVVTICITALTLVINVLITLKTSRQNNYNKIITESRLEFMRQNRINATQFIAEANNIVFSLKQKNNKIDLKPLYCSFAHLRVALKSYNDIESEILGTGNNILLSVEKSINDNVIDGDLITQIEAFTHLINIYDDADWKFIKLQFNSSNKKSEDFDDICNEIKSKY